MKDTQAILSEKLLTLLCTPPSSLSMSPEQSSYLSQNQIRSYPKVKIIPPTSHRQYFSPFGSAKIKRCIATQQIVIFTKSALQKCTSIVIMRNRMVHQNVHLAHYIYLQPYLSMYLSTVREYYTSSVVTSESSWNFLAKFTYPIESLPVETYVSLTINVSNGYSIAANSSSASCRAYMSVSNDVLS